MAPGEMNNSFQTTIPASVNSKRQCVYDDFSSPTAIRQHRLIVEGKSLYVNLGYLAEYSPFFANSYEQNENTICLDRYKYDDVLELMRCLFYCPQRKPITEGNICAIFRMAQVLDMEQVLKRCEDLIASKGGTFNPNSVFQLTQVVADQQRNSLSMSILMDRLARLEDNQLSNLPFDHLPGDVVADLYAVKLRQAGEKRSKKKTRSWWNCQLCCGFGALFPKKKKQRINLQNQVMFSSSYCR